MLNLQHMLRLRQQSTKWLANTLKDVRLDSISLSQREVEVAAEAAVIAAVVVAVVALEEAEASVTEEAVEEEVAEEADSEADSTVEEVETEEAEVDHQDSPAPEKCYEHHNGHAHSVIEVNGEYNLYNKFLNIYFWVPLCVISFRPDLTE